MTRPYLKIVKARRDWKIFYSVIVVRVPRYTYTAHHYTLCMKQYGTFWLLAICSPQKMGKKEKNFCDR